MSKGTASQGLKLKQRRIVSCRRCGQKKLNIKKKICNGCSFKI